MKMHKHDRSAIQSTAGDSSMHTEGVGAGDRVKRVAALVLRREARARRGEGVLLPAAAITRS